MLVAMNCVMIVLVFGYTLKSYKNYKADILQAKKWVAKPNYLSKIP